MLKRYLDNVFSPSQWPRNWRRAFLLTLPISGPIWLAVAVISALALGIAVFVIGLPWMLWEEWVKPMWAKNDTRTGLNTEAE